MKLNYKENRELYHYLFALSLYFFTLKYMQILSLFSFVMLFFAGIFFYLSQKKFIIVSSVSILALAAILQQSNLISEVIGLHIAIMAFIKLIEKKISYLSIIMILSMIVLISQMVSYLTHPELFNQQIDLIESSLQKSSHQLLKNTPENKEMMILFEEKIIPFYKKIYFFFQYIDQFFLFFISIFFLSRIKNRFGLYLFHPLKFSQLRFDSVWFWLFLLSLLIQILFKGTLFLIGLNFMLAILFCYFLYGLSIIASLINRSPKKIILTLLFISFMFIFPLLILFIPLFGLSDYFVNWKEKFNIKMI